MPHVNAQVGELGAWAPATSGEESVRKNIPPSFVSFERQPRKLFGSLFESKGNRRSCMQNKLKAHVAPSFR